MAAAHRSRFFFFPPPPPPPPRGRRGDHSQAPLSSSDPSRPLNGAPFFFFPPPPSFCAPSPCRSVRLNREEADRFAARLRDRGYAPYIVTAEVPGKGTWYRVRMGSFASKDAASRYLQDFKRETQLDAFVASAR